MTNNIKLSRFAPHHCCCAGTCQVTLEASRPISYSLKGLPNGRKLWRSKSFANLQLWIFGEKYFGESVIIFTILIKAYYVYYSAAASRVPFVPSDFCDLAKMATVGFSVECMIRGYHEYKSIWENPSIGETLICEREIGNCHDTHAVAIKKTIEGDIKTVGHVPRKISAICSIFMNR